MARTLRTEVFPKKLPGAEGYTTYSLRNRIIETEKEIKEKKKRVFISFPFEGVKEKNCKKITIPIFANENYSPSHHYSKKNRVHY